MFGFVRDPARRRLVQPPARVLGLILCAVVLIAGCDWLQPGFDAGLSGVQPVETTLTPNAVSQLHQLFAVRLGGSGSNTAPLVAFGAVFATACSGSSCIVTRRDLRTGAAAWSTPIGQGASSPAITGNSVVLATVDGVAAYDPETGQRQWLHATAAPVVDLLVDRGRVFAGEAVGEDITYAASIEVFDATDGHGLWSKAQGTWFGDHFLVVADGVVYANHSTVQTFDGVDEYDAATGAPIRRVSGCRVGVFANGLLYRGASACDPANGNTVWSGPATGAGASPAVGDRLVVPTADTAGKPRLRAYDARTGALVWDHAAGPSGAVINTQPVIAGDVVYAGSARVAKHAYTRTLAAYRLRNGRRLASLTIPGAAGAQVSPAIVVASGAVYLQAAGILYAFTGASN